MFKSKVRPIVIPQLEHARMAGHIASIWGNEQFASPAIDKHSFVLGVIDHDRGYDAFDTMSIGEVDEAIWLATQKRGILRALADPVADAVALMHIRRLLNPGDTDAEKEVIALAEQRIADVISQTAYSREQFQQADSITDVCDMASFIFSFEEPRQITRSVFSDGEIVDMQIALRDDGQVTLDPYPLAVPELRGVILGYEAYSYPDHLQPVVVAYHIASVI